MVMVPFPIFGPTYKVRNLPVGSQVTRNFYPEVDDQGTELTSLSPFPGLKLFGTAGTGGNRNMGVLNGILYTISGTELYEVAAGGTATLKGAIAGSNRCGVTNDGNVLVITNGSNKPYSFDGTTVTLGTDVDLVNSNTSAFINKRVVYDGNNGDVIFADLNSPLIVTSATVLVAEANPDDSNAVWAFKQQLHVAGDETIQPFWNSGVGNPPYDPVNNAVQQVGVTAFHTIAKNKEFSYFLGSDLNVYRYDGLSTAPIGDSAICQQIASYGVTSDAYGICFSFHGSNFYLLSFPTGNETWLYHEQSQLWTNLAYGTQGDQHLISAYAYVYGKHLVADRRNGNIYELDFDTYTDNGDVIQRQRDTVSINGNSFERPGTRVTMNSLQLVIDPGVSLVSSEATIIMQYSDNNGRTWSSEDWATIGEQGDYDHILEWYSLGSFRNRMFRFRMTDPVKWVLIKAMCDVEFSID